MAERGFTESMISGICNQCNITRTDFICDCCGNRFCVRRDCQKAHLAEGGGGCPLDMCLDDGSLEAEDHDSIWEGSHASSPDLVETAF